MSRKLFVLTVLAGLVVGVCLIPFNVLSQILANLAWRRVENAITPPPTPVVTPVQMPSPILTPQPTIVIVVLSESGETKASATLPHDVCVISVKPSAVGINIYPDITEMFDGYEIGYLLASDGMVLVQELRWTDGPDGTKYRWALISVRGMTGFVHADPPWTATPAPC